MEVKENLNKYLVRPTDFHIFELDESNNCYRSWSTRVVTYSDGIRPNAEEHFTYDNLTENYHFFPIQESELEFYELENQYMNSMSQTDGHVVIREKFFDYNELTLDQMVEYLREKFMFSSSGDAKCIYHLIEFYDQNKKNK